MEKVVFKGKINKCTEDYSSQKDQSCLQFALKDCGGIMQSKIFSGTSTR
jgi:hypothetical protein